MADDCLFCSMVEGTVPVDFVYSDKSAVAIADLNPQAPTHLLVIPRAHVATIADIGADREAAAGWLGAIRGVVAQEGLSDYRTVCNSGTGAGQSVFHLHAHLLAGRPFSWPPG